MCGCKRGGLKIDTFRNSDNKLDSAYLLTRIGVEHKARMTVQFLKYKVLECERLRAENRGIAARDRKKFAGDYS